MTKLHTHKFFRSLNLTGQGKKDRRPIMKSARTKVIFLVGIMVMGLIAVIWMIAGVLPGDRTVARPGDWLPGLKQASGESSATGNRIRVENRTVTFKGEEANTALEKDGKYESLGAALEAARHAVERIAPGNPDARGAEYFAANPSQQLRAWFSRDGVELASGIPTPDDEHPWAVALRMRQIGRGSDVTAIHPKVSNSGGGRMESSDPETGVTQWFENRSEGLEHGFTLHRKCAGEGNEVMIRMAVEGTLRAEKLSTAEGEGVRFVDGNGQETVHYTGLRAWDAEGRDLAARMEVRGDFLELSVNDCWRDLSRNDRPAFRKRGGKTAADFDRRRRIRLFGGLERRHRTGGGSLWKHRLGYSCGIRLCVRAGGIGLESAGETFVGRWPGWRSLRKLGGHRWRHRTDRSGKRYDGTPEGVRLCKDSGAVDPAGGVSQLRRRDLFWNVSGPERRHCAGERLWQGCLCLRPQ